MPMTREERAEYTRQWREKLRARLGPDGFRRWTRKKNKKIHSNRIARLGIEGALVWKREVGRKHYETKVKPRRAIALAERAKNAAAELLVTVASSIPPHEHLPIALAAAWLEGYNTLRPKHGRRRK